MRRTVGLGLALLAIGACQSLSPVTPDRVEKDHAWQVVVDMSGRTPRVTLGITGDGGLVPGRDGRTGGPVIHVSFICRIDQFVVDAAWGGPWPATDSPNEGYTYARGEMRVLIDGRLVWRDRGAGYSRPGMIAAGDDLSDPGTLPAALMGAGTLDIEARFEDGITQPIRLDLSGREDLSGLNIAQDRAAAIFARRCTEIRTGRLLGR